MRFVMLSATWDGTSEVWIRPTGILGFYRRRFGDAEYTVVNLSSGDRYDVSEYPAEIRAKIEESERLSS